MHSSRAVTMPRIETEASRTRAGRVTLVLSAAPSSQRARSVARTVLALHLGLGEQVGELGEHEHGALIGGEIVVGAFADCDVDVLDGLDDALAGVDVAEEVVGGPVRVELIHDHGGDAGGGALAPGGAQADEQGVQGGEVAVGADLDVDPAAEPIRRT